VQWLIRSASLPVVLLVVGCAAKPQAAGQASTVPAPNPRNPVIVHIVNQHRTITISSSSQGLLYSMKDANGNMQITDARSEKFAALEPELYQQIKHYIAVHADDAPIPSAGFDAPIPTADTHGSTPPLNGERRTFRGSGSTADEFKRTAERPFPTAREDAE
jgi:hypothetical protein